MRDSLQQRINQAAESLLDNESLSADLDDATAEALMSWGLGCAELIVRGTAGMDDTAAETFMEPKLSAVRQLMRLVNRWVASIMAGKPVVLWAEVIEQAAIIYPDYQLPASEQQQVFLGEPFPEDLSQWIVKLRTLVGGTPKAEAKVSAQFES